jgi:hypothetical protein
VVAEYSDEAASAFKGNRGAGLTAAKDAAITAGAELWVQRSDRLARGDGITADHLAEVWFALRRHGVRLRSVGRQQPRGRHPSRAHRRAKSRGLKSARAQRPKPA